MTTLEARAREIAQKVTCGWFHCEAGYSHRCDEYGEPMTREIAAALVAFAREHATRALEVAAMRCEQCDTWIATDESEIKAALAAAEGSDK